MKELSNLLTSNAESQVIEIQKVRKSLRSEIGVLKMMEHGLNVESIDAMHKVLDMVILDLQVLADEDIGKVYLNLCDMQAGLDRLSNQIESASVKPKQTRTRKPRTPKVEDDKKVTEKPADKPVKKQVEKKVDPVVKKEDQPEKK